MREEISVQFFNALKAHFVAQREKAMVTLKLYLTDSVAIGDHPNVVDEMIRLTKHLSESDEALETLHKYFTKSDTK